MRGQISVAIDGRRVVTNETARVSGLTKILFATDPRRFVRHHAAGGPLAASRQAPPADLPFSVDLRVSV